MLQCPLQFQMKFFMDDFNKVTLIQITQNTQSIINEYDVAIHPKINHYNLRCIITNIILFIMEK